MPELPEVETVKNELIKTIHNKKLKDMQIHCNQLRKPISKYLPEILINKKVLDITRKAKYILVKFEHGYLGIHLGMSGTIRTDKKNTAIRKHDHVEFEFSNLILRYNDPRRFGLIFWSNGHNTPKLLNKIGIEPLAKEFNAKYLYSLCQQSNKAIKLLLMDGSKIAGIGNIYASEILFKAKINPTKNTQKITLANAKEICKQVKSVLKRATKAGGSSISDHRYGDDKLGYFQLEHKVYGKANETCKICKHKILKIIQGQRSTFYCPKCQR